MKGQINEENEEFKSQIMQKTMTKRRSVTESLLAIIHNRESKPHY